MRYIKINDKYYLNIGLTVIYKVFTFSVEGPDKCEKWRWFNLDSLLDKILEGIELVMRNFKSNKIY